MGANGRTTAHTKNRRAGARIRLVGRLLALNLVFFSSPLLSGWLALASANTGTKFVQLCTSKGLRLVAVPAEDALPAPQPADDARTGSDCAACPLGKCSGASFGPAPVSHIDPTTVGVDAPMAVTDHLATTGRAVLGPPTRAPPAVS